jgi:hypothetical protein
VQAEWCERFICSKVEAEWNHSVHGCLSYSDEAGVEEQLDQEQEQHAAEPEQQPQDGSGSSAAL